VGDGIAVDARFRENDWHDHTWGSFGVARGGRF
jgi:hypothetical protein